MLKGNEVNFFFMLDFIIRQVELRFLKSQFEVKSDFDTTQDCSQSFQNSAFYHPLILVFNVLNCLSF